MRLVEPVILERGIPVEAQWPSQHLVDEYARQDAVAGTISCFGEVSLVTSESWKAQSGIRPQRPVFVD